MGGVSVQGGLCLLGVSVSRGVSVHWGSSSGGGSLSGPDIDPPYGKERTIRILLECILAKRFIGLTVFELTASDMYCVTGGVRTVRCTRETLMEITAGTFCATFSPPAKSASDSTPTYSAVSGNSDSAWRR